MAFLWQQCGSVATEIYVDTYKCLSAKYFKIKAKDYCT